MQEERFKVGKIQTLSMCKQIDRVIWDYNRSRTCIKVLYKHSSLTDEMIMPVQVGCKIWICSKSITKDNFFGFMEYEVLQAGRGKLLDETVLHSEVDLEELKIEKEKAEFIMYAIKKLS